MAKRASSRLAHSRKLAHNKNIEHNRNLNKQIEAEIEKIEDNEAMNPVDLLVGSRKRNKCSTRDEPEPEIQMDGKPFMQCFSVLTSLTRRDCRVTSWLKFEKRYNQHEFFRRPVKNVYFAS